MAGQSTITAETASPSKLGLPFVLTFCTLALLYAAFSWPIIQFNIPTDFKTFYLSAQALTLEQSPYKLFHNININPPLFIILSKPLAYLTQQQAFVLWQSISMLLMMLSGYLTLSCTPSAPKKLSWLLLLSFPVMVNARMGQVASLLFFLMICGFILSQQKRDIAAGAAWGLAAALKFFPGLLIFYAIYYRRAKLFIAICGFGLAFFSLPAFLGYSQLYSGFINALDYVYWYGHEWNVSFYGYLFRLLFSIKPSQAEIHIAKLFMLIPWLSALVLSSYYLLIKREKPFEQHQYFSVLCLAMLLLCPLSWLYYLPICFCAIIYYLAQWPRLTNSQSLLFTISIFFMLFPINRPIALPLYDLGYKLSVDSFAFYGLCLLLLIFIADNNPSTSKPIQKHWATLTLAYLATTALIMMTLYSNIIYLGLLILPNS